jgi:hypothetical protein
LLQEYEHGLDEGQVGTTNYVVIKDMVAATTNDLYKPL